MPDTPPPTRVFSPGSPRFNALDLFDPKAMDLTAPTPYIPVRSRHFQYATLVVAGYTYREACKEMSIEERTARAWRERLRRAGRRYFGRPVTYDFVARFALDMEMIHVFEECRARQAAKNRMADTTQHFSPDLDE